MPKSMGAVKLGGWLGAYGDWPAVATLPASPPAPTFPNAPLDVSVQILVDNSWIDISRLVYAGTRADITVTRGRQNEAGQTDPSTAAMEFNNRDGLLSPRNPTSVLYGKIGRNTQVRAAIGGQVRFSGEISEWPQRWDRSGRDVWVPVVASGILRRLRQGSSPLQSALYRAYTRNAPPPQAYWPGEDAAGATRVASAVGGPAMTFGTPQPTFTASTVFKCASPLLKINNAVLRGNVPVYTQSADTQLFLLMNIPTGAGTAGQSIIRFNTVAGGLATDVNYWELIYDTTGGALRIKAVDVAGTAVVDDPLSLLPSVNDKLLQVRIWLNQGGGASNILYQVDTLEVGATAPSTDSGIYAGTGFTRPRVTRVTVNAAGGLGTDITIGHIALFDQQITLNSLQVGAYAGETAAARIRRLCSEESVAVRITGDIPATAAVGAQLPTTLGELLQDAADADGGILYEPRDLFGLAYRTRESLYNQAPVLALDYAQAHLSEIEPTDDDQQTRNDITVTRADGSSARAVQQDGTMSVLDPPAGVGRYDTAVTLNLQADGQLVDAAGWLLHLGTVDEARYPVLGLNLAHPKYAADPALTAAARALDVGDRLTVSNLPAWLPPDAISQLAQGFTETMGSKTHRIDVHGAPESPWGQVGRYNDGVARYSSSGSTLQAVLGTTDTSVSVSTPLGALWSHTDGDFNIRLGGEVMTVTAISGATSPQTFTVTRSVNGVVKSHAAGEVIALDHPTVYVR